MKDKVLRNTIKANITISAALSMTLMLSLILVCFKSVSDVTYNTRIKESCMLAIESAFSAYHNDMVDEYDILLLEKTDYIDGRIKDYVEKNIGVCGKDVELMSLIVDNPVYITSDGGDKLRKEIVSYMKYGVYSEVAEAFMQSEQQVKKTEKINEITSDIAACEEELFVMDEKVLELIKLVEGIDTEETGIVIRKGKPVPVSGSFAKCAVNGDITPDSVNVDNSMVYDAVSQGTPGYSDVSVILTDMLEDVDGLYEIGDKESEASGNNSYAQIYRRNYEMLREAISGARNKTIEALDVISGYHASKAEADKKIENCISKVEEGRDTLGEELYAGLMEDLKDIKSEGVSEKRELCNIQTISQALNRNKIILDGAYGLLKQLDINLLQSNCKEARQKIVLFQSSLLGLSNRDIGFDYSVVDFSSESIGLSVIKKIKQLITDGMLALVTDTEKISAKTIDFKDLSTFLTENYDSTDTVIKKTADTLLMDEYLMTKFNSFTDYIDMETDGDALLDYTLEYILCGNNSDKENMEQTILELSGIRTGMNLAYLLTDRTKKAEALALASSALGFTGNMAVVKAGQYLILSVWAYGEAVIDIKALCAGKKVDLVKTKDNWNLSLEGLLMMKFDGDKEESKTGIDYEGYIRMLLFMENSAHKNYRTMGAMELKMISMGHKDFRMKNYIVSVDGTAIFKCKGQNQSYKQIFSYSYV